MATVCLNVIAQSDGISGGAGFSCDSLVDCFDAHVSISVPSSKDVLQMSDGEWKNVPLKYPMEWTWFNTGLVTTTTDSIRRVVPYAGYIGGMGLTLRTAGTTATVVELRRVGSATVFETITLPAGDTAHHFTGVGVDVYPGWEMYPVVTQAGDGSADLGIQVWYNYWAIEEDFDG